MSMNRPYYLDPIFVSAPSRNEAASATHSYQPRTLSRIPDVSLARLTSLAARGKAPNCLYALLASNSGENAVSTETKPPGKSLYTFVSCEPPILLKTLPETASPNSLTARSDQKPVYLEHLMEFVVFR